MAKRNVPAPQPSQPDARPYRGLLERVAASRKFQKSARMRELLLYLGGRSLEQPGCEIREQEIGVAVFGRPPHYDTVADTPFMVFRTRVDPAIALEYNRV